MNSEVIVSKTTHSLNCLIYYPNVYTDLPLLVYLHGAGEHGKRIEHVNRHGVPKLVDEGKEIPAVLFAAEIKKRKKTVL
ncbi:MAG: hypothetical protein KBS52_06160 [Clostridiales bacterium]|nr:hypothetical protein [Candidatus Equinaster intestinalis]